MANLALVGFGLWSWFARVRARGAWRGLAWFWVALESLNGIAHLLLALGTRDYFPGAATAPLLLALGLGWGAAAFSKDALSRHRSNGGLRRRPTRVISRPASAADGDEGGSG